MIPTKASLAGLMAVLTNGGAELREQATPALPLTGLLAMTTVFVGLIAVVVDLVAVAGRQAALAGVALLALVLRAGRHDHRGHRARRARGTRRRARGAALVRPAPAGRLGQPAAGARTHRAAGHRHRRRAADRGGGTGRRPARRRRRPHLRRGIPDHRARRRVRRGSATGTSLDPVAEMVGQLTLPQPIDLLRMDTSVDDPGYLRSVTLDKYDNTRRLDAEQPRRRGVHRRQRPPGPAPAEGAGTHGAGHASRSLRHDDRFLPVPTSPLAVRMQGDQGDGWRFDPATGTVFGRAVTSAGRTYTVVAERAAPPGRAAGRRAPPLPADNRVQAQYTRLPDLDPRILAKVADVIGGATTPYERVRSIHAYLTDRANGFRYSLATEPGTSGDHLVDFLTLRRGYCEQYAGTMAVMVRAAGVPARVALGYTPGTVQNDGSRLITSDDAHAWVEVYFQSLGWVPFDPTPLSAAARSPCPGRPGPTRRPYAATPARQRRPRRPRRPARGHPPGPRRRRGAGRSRRDRPPAGTPWLAAGRRRRSSWWRSSWETPAGIRVLRRRRRLAAGTAGALWDELAATALDVGVRLQPSWTPATCRARTGGGGRAGWRPPRQRRGRRHAAGPGGGSGLLRAGRRRCRSPGWRRRCAPRAGACCVRRPAASGSGPCCGPPPCSPDCGPATAAGGPGSSPGCVRPTRPEPRSGPCTGAPECTAAAVREGRRLPGRRYGRAATGRSGGGTAPRAGSSAADGRPGPPGGNDRRWRNRDRRRSCSPPRPRRWLSCS